MIDDLTEGQDGSSVEIISTHADPMANLMRTFDNPLNVKGASVQFPYEPQTVGELLRTEYLYRTLSLSKVFIHNRKGESEELLAAVSTVIGGYSEIKRFKSHVTRLTTILKKIKSLPEVLSKPQVWVIEATDVTADINKFCVSIDLIKRRQIGIWVLAHISDLTPRTLSLFDAFFFFDMPSSQLNSLRTSLSISEENAQKLRRGPNELIRKNKVLFFLNSFGRDDLPFLKENPIILGQIKEMPVDITPLVPIAVEAAKFIFNETSQWIKAIRKKHNQPIEDEKKDNSLALPVLDRDGFTHLESDYEALKASLDKVALEVNAYRIKGLMEQLRSHHRSLTDLEGQAAIYGIDVPTRIRRQIEIETESIISNTAELEDLVSKVYQKKISS